MESLIAAIVDPELVTSVVHSVHGENHPPVVAPDWSGGKEYRALRMTAPVQAVPTPRQLQIDLVRLGELAVGHDLADPAVVAVVRIEHLEEPEVHPLVTPDGHAVE